MPISSMQLRFLDGELGKIDIDINEKGISTVTGLGYGVWSSDNLTTLVTLLDSRYGRHSLKTKLVCDHAGRCGRAPTQKTFTWSPLNSTVTLTYVESTNNTNPKLTFLSTKFATETDALRARAWRVREQIDQEERAAKDKTMRARGNDL